MQSRKMSFIETVTGRFLGLSAAVGLQHVIFPHYGWDITLGDSVMVALLFTLTSLIISFNVRRFFVWLEGRGIN